MTACSDPFTKSGLAFGCGRCLPCTTIKRRIWQSRIMLETKDHAENTFITLTYNEETMPPSGSLDPHHSRDFLKRLRKHMEPITLRYFLVGEYGTENKRPHYHAALFNYPNCSFGRSRYSKSRTQCCNSCDTILHTWGRGLVHLGDITPESAAYIAGYTTKKLLNKNDPSISELVPEFSRMSRRPGIGAPLMHDIADSLLQHYTDNQGRYTSDDVPTELRSGTKTYPLGRFLRRKLRTYVGRDENAPQKTLDQMAHQMYALRKIAFDNSLSFKTSLVSATAGKRANLIARHNRYKKKDTL